MSFWGKGSCLRALSVNLMINYELISSVLKEEAFSFLGRGKTASLAGRTQDIAVPGHKIIEKVQKASGK